MLKNKTIFNIYDNIIIIIFLFTYIINKIVELISIIILK